MITPRAALFALSLLVGVVSCKGLAPADEAERVAVVAAVDAVRDAPEEPIAARRALLVTLQSRPARTPRVLEVRDICALAYGLVIDGRDEEKRVKQALEGEAAPGPETVQQLLDAQGKIEKSKRLLPECHAVLAVLRNPTP